VPQRWLVLEVLTPGAAEDAATEELLALGGRAVEQSEDRIRTHLEPVEDPDALAAELRRRLEVAGFAGSRVEWHWQEHRDWQELWKQGLGLRRITDRIAVLPSWHAPGEELPEITLVIDPGMAFGTAEHATTRSCLRLLEGAVRSGDRILDAGSGSAILSIAAVKLGAGEVEAVETDPYACEAALENVHTNEAPGIHVINAAVSAEWLVTRAPYDGIVGNIQLFVLAPLLEHFRGRLKPEGWLILSGILVSEWDELQAAARSAGFSLQESEVEGEWRSGLFSPDA